MIQYNDIRKEHFKKNDNTTFSCKDDNCKTSQRLYKDNLYELALHLRLEHESAFNNIDPISIPPTKVAYKVNFHTTSEYGQIIIKCNDCKCQFNSHKINAMDIIKHAKSHQETPVNKELKGKGFYELNADGSLAFEYFTIKHQNILSFICCECNFYSNANFSQLRNHICIDTHKDFISEKVSNKFYLI
jgi:hypothetical protein